MADRSASRASKTSSSGRKSQASTFNKVTLAELTTGANCEGSSWKPTTYFGRTKALEVSQHNLRPARGKAPQSLETTASMHGAIPKGFYGTQFYRGPLNGGSAVLKK